MMPKGAEHLTCLCSAVLQYVVRIPMMPKGVEHKPKISECRDSNA